MTPTLTVITPVFNGEKYIEACIRNVMKQNCSDVEHLIIDGNSTDNTKKIVGELAMAHQNIIFLTQDDEGQSNAMNKGVELANAPVIGFLNVDDFYEPKILKKVIRAFKDLKEPSLLVGDCNIINDNDEVTSVNKPNKLKITDLIAGRVFPYNPSAYFYHRSLHDTIGPYDENDHYTMDLDFILRAVQSTQPHYHAETWGNFRFIDGTKTFSESEAGNMFDRCDAVKLRYYKKLNLFQKLSVQIKTFKDKLDKKLG